MSTNIYVDSCCGLYMGAVADDKKLIEYRVEKINQIVTIGSIFKGRVQNVISGMQAAFVDVGLQRNGYLSAGDMLMDKYDLEGNVEIPSILNLSVGDEIMVQAVKDPAGTKGVKLTTNISFAGRYVVFMPNMDFVGVSRKILDPDTRERLMKMASELKREGMGVIIRTAGESASREDVKNEIDFFAKQFEKIELNFKKHAAPCCVFEEDDLALRFFRDVYKPGMGRFVVSDKEIYDKLLKYSEEFGDGSLKKNIQLYKEKVDMFTFYGIAADVDTILSNRVELQNGAYLIIDKTEAMTTIDVNTGSYVGDSNNLEDTVFATNIVAAKEIARQLKLRNIAGIIIVDFIDMTEEEHKEMLLEVLRKAVEDDRAKCSVMGLSQLGLVEITRKKKRRESSYMMLRPCPYCNGSGFIQTNDYISLKIRAGLLDLFEKGYMNAIVDLNIETCDYILSKGFLRKDIDKIWPGKRIYLVPHKTYHHHMFLIRGDDNSVMDVPDKAILLY